MLTGSSPLHYSSHQHQKRKRKREAESESEKREREIQHLKRIDYTQTCAIDILLHTTTFMEDEDARSFAHTSKSNLAALRRYEYKGSFDIVRHLLKYSQSLDKNADDSGRSMSHPQFAFGQWNAIHIDCDRLASFHSWRSNASNQSSVKLLGDYIQSREMMKLNSLSQSLIVSGYLQNRTAVTLKWLVELFPLRPYKLTNVHQRYESFLKVEELKLLHDTIPEWNHIQVLDIESFIIPSHVESVCAFPSSLTQLRLRKKECMEYDGDDDWSQVVLPRSLKKFEFACQHGQSTKTHWWPQMPETLETLIVHRFAHSMKNYRLPPSLTELQLEHSQMRRPDSLVLSLKECRLPSTLKLLRLAFWNLPVEQLCELPNSLETLEFGDEFNQPVDQLRLPPSLKSLIFGFRFNHSIDSLILPPSLTHLSFGPRFNQPIRGDIFPPPLKSLIFGHNFNQPIRDWKLPHSLTQLQFGYEFDQPIHDLPLDFWPASLVSFDWWQHPLKWISSPSNISYGCASNESSTSTTPNRANVRDESQMDDSSNPKDNVTLKPIFDRTIERQEILTYGRNEVKQMLENIRQAELNNLIE